MRGRRVHAHIETLTQTLQKPDNEGLNPNQLDNQPKPLLQRLSKTAQALINSACQHPLTNASHVMGLLFCCAPHQALMRLACVLLHHSAHFTPDVHAPIVHAPTSSQKLHSAGDTAKTQAFSTVQPHTAMSAAAVADAAVSAYASSFSPNKHRPTCGQTMQESHAKKCTH